MRIFSLNVVQTRVENLKIILPNILKQCNRLFVNLIGFDNIPDILNHKKIKVNYFYKGGSEIRFFNYKDCKDDCYYFTIDDDILYPEDYSDVMIEHMNLYKNNSICCVHGSDLDLSLTSNFYKNRKKVYHFTHELENDIKVMVPGVGTSCFCKKTMKINLIDFKTPNMSDPYVSSFAYKQNIPVYCISRTAEWLKKLDEKNTSIWGNNPHTEIDRLITKTFKNDTIYYQ